MSTLLPIVRDDRSLDLAAAAGQTTFTFDKPLFSADDLTVWRKVAPAAIFTEVTSGFSVALIGEGVLGASVVFAVAPRPIDGVTDVTVRLESRRIDERISDITRGGKIHAQGLERQGDITTTVLQELRRDINRVSLTDAELAQATAAAARAEQAAIDASAFANSNMPWFVNKAGAVASTDLGAVTTIIVGQSFYEYSADPVGHGGGLQNTASGRWFKLADQVIASDHVAFATPADAARFAFEEDRFYVVKTDDAASITFNPLAETFPDLCKWVHGRTRRRENTNLLYTDFQIFIPLGNTNVGEGTLNLDNVYLTGPGSTISLSYSGGWVTATNERNIVGVSFAHVSGVTYRGTVEFDTAHPAHFVVGGPAGLYNVHGDNDAMAIVGCQKVETIPTSTSFTFLFTFELGNVLQTYYRAPVAPTRFASGAMYVTGISAAFTAGQVLTGTTSGATARIVKVITRRSVPNAGAIYVEPISGTFTSGEAVTDALGGAASASTVPAIVNGQSHNRVMMYSAWLTAMPNGWPGGNIEGYINLYNGAKMTARFIALMFGGTGGVERDLVFVHGSGSSFRGLDYSGYWGAEDKVFRTSENGSVSLNRCCIGGGTLAEDGWHGQKGGFSDFVRCAFGSFRQDGLLAGDGVGFAAAGCQIASARYGIYVTGASAAANVNTSQFSGLTYGWRCDLGTITAADGNNSFIERSWRATLRNGNASLPNLMTYSEIADATVDAWSSATPSPRLGGVTADNELDAFQKNGTFIPTLLLGAGAAGITYAADGRNGYFTRVGDVVHVMIAIKLTSKGSATGAATITGLPFAAKATAPPLQVLSAGNVSGVSYSANYSAMFARVAAGATVLSLHEQGNNVAPAALNDTDFTNTSEFILHGSYHL
jgi:hypothetical protein